MQLPPCPMQRGCDHPEGSCGCQARSLCQRTAPGTPCKGILKAVRGDDESHQLTAQGTRAVACSRLIAGCHQWLPSWRSGLKPRRARSSLTPGEMRRSYRSLRKRTASRIDGSALGSDSSMQYYRRSREQRDAFAWRPGRSSLTYRLRAWHPQDPSG